mgnify:CR=1 FL=1
MNDCRGVNNGHRMNRTDPNHAGPFMKICPSKIHSDNHLHMHNIGTLL